MFKRKFILMDDAPGAAGGANPVARSEGSMPTTRITTRRQR